MTLQEAVPIRSGCSNEQRTFPVSSSQPACLGEHSTSAPSQLCTGNMNGPVRPESIGHHSVLAIHEDKAAYEGGRLGKDQPEHTGTWPLRVSQLWR